MAKKILTLACLLLLAPALHAETYPTRPIKVYHGFGPGGPPDLTLRRIAAELEKRLGQPIVVENRPGASGTIAASLVAQAPPDGYTLLFGVAANLAVAPAAMSRPAYRPDSAFTAIIEVARGPYVWLVPTASPARTMSEFIALARQSPGKLNFASPGVASVHHLATETMLRRAGVTMTHVPYSTGKIYSGILGGDIDGMFESMPSPLPHLRAGKVRALAVTGSRRIPELGDVPTLEELGIADPGANSWWGLVGPRGLPAEIVELLNRQVGEVLREPDVVGAFRGMSIEPSPGTSAAFDAYIKAQFAHWRRQARELAIELH